MKRAHYRRFVPNAIPSMPGESGLARPGSPTDTSRIRWVDETDSDSSGLLCEERRGGLALLRAILPPQTEWAPAFSTFGTIQCEI